MPTLTGADYIMLALAAVGVVAGVWEWVRRRREGDEPWE